MGLYDKNYDWYDRFVPFSDLPAIFGNSGKSIGNLVNNLTGATSMAEFNSAEAEKQRNWEEEMSNTAYQRSVKDMEEAGINPALAYSQGGASTPTGMSASGSTSGSSIANTINSATKLIQVVSKIATGGKSFGFGK